MTKVCARDYAGAMQQLEESLKRLRELQKARDDLMRMIVHDLKTPLTSMLATLEMLRDGDFGAIDERPARALTLVELAERPPGFVGLEKLLQPVALAFERSQPAMVLSGHAARLQGPARGLLEKSEPRHGEAVPITSGEAMHMASPTRRTLQIKAPRCPARAAGSQNQEKAPTAQSMRDRGHSIVPGYH